MFKKSKKKLKNVVGFYWDEKELTYTVIENKEVVRQDCIEAVNTLGLEQAFDSLMNDINLTNYNIHWVMPHNSYVIHSLEAPDVADEELADAVKWEMVDVVDFPPENAIVKVFDMPDVNSRGKDNFIYGCAINKEGLFKDIIGVCEKNKLQLNIVNIPELVIRNVLEKLENNATSMYMHIANNAIFSLVYKTDQIYFSNYSIKRSIKEGMGDLIVDVMVSEAMRTVDYYDRHFMSTPIESIEIADSILIESDYIDKIADDAGITASNLDFEDLISSQIQLNYNGNYLMSLGAALD